jgi:hypothetical protein
MGARPPRALFSAPSRKTRAGWKHSSVRGRFARKQRTARARSATPEGGRGPQLYQRAFSEFVGVLAGGAGSRLVTGQDSFLDYWFG